MESPTDRRSRRRPEWRSQGYSAPGGGRRCLRMSGGTPPPLPVRSAAALAQILVDRRLNDILLPAPGPERRDAEALLQRQREPD